MDTSAFKRYYLKNYNYREVLDLLVQRGGDLLIGTPLYEATQEGHFEVASYIVQQLKKTVSVAVIYKIQ